MYGTQSNSAEMTQLLGKPSIGQPGRRISTVSMPGRRESLLHRDLSDALLEPLFTPQSIQISDTPHGEGAVDRVRNIIAADEDANDGRSHEPRPLFCELLVFRSAGDAADSALHSKQNGDQDANVQMYQRVPFWQESSRWIKFEETVEEGGSRWSKPHVTLLNVKSLLQIRSCLQKHATLLDVEAKSFGHVVELLAASWTKAHLLITEDEVIATKDALLSPKKHLVKTRVRSEKSKPYEDANGEDISRGASPYATVTSTTGEALQKAALSMATTKMAINQSLFRKLPDTAEAAVIFIGYVVGLHRPISGFVRLLIPTIFNDVTELPIPTRFLFVLLLPIEHSEVEGAKLGKCMGTLFVDEVFSRVCYKARHGYELAYAIDEFLGQTVVVPPGKWNPNSRLEPPENQVATSRLVVANDAPKRLVAKTFSDPEEEAPPIQRTGRLFGGLVDDIKRKVPWYISDFTDVTKGRVSQTLAAAIFLFFANISKIITFGGVMDHALDKQIGAIENVLAGGICGVIYALFAGQPLCVLSATGPCLVFEVILFQLAKTMGWPFLPLRACVGIWTAVVLVVFVALDASAMVALISRFTEEAFATMISIIFLIKAVEELLEIKHFAPVITDPETFLNKSCSCLANDTFFNASAFAYNRTTTSAYNQMTTFAYNQTSTFAYNQTANTTHTDNAMCPRFLPDVFMFSIVLFFATFAIAMALKMLRHSPFFPSKVRQIVADFNVTIAIFVMSLVNKLVGLAVPCLAVPSEIRPTSGRDSWIVNPFSLTPWWLGLVTIFPAIFFSILVMLDQNITSVIINRKDNKLEKSYGYHLDLAVIAVLMVVCSVFGIPFYVAATVISLMHVESLRLTSETVAPGEKAQFLGLREQRVTAFIAHLLIGLAVFLTPVMKHLPMPVLLGVFLYMGIVSLAGQQFVKRVLILFMPAKHQPDYPWLRLVRLKRVNLFTIIQIISLIFLMVVEEQKKISMVFPLMLVIMIFIRKILLARIFTPKELSALDDPVPSWCEVFRPKRNNNKSPNHTVQNFNGSHQLVVTLAEEENFDK